MHPLIALPRELPTQIRLHPQAITTWSFLTMPVTKALMVPNPPEPKDHKAPRLARRNRLVCAIRIKNSISILKGSEMTPFFIRARYTVRKDVLQNEA